MGASAASVACCAGGLAVMGGLQRSTDKGVGSGRRASPPAGDLAMLQMLEAQAAKLRATIARRSRCPDASCKDDDVRAIVGHYCQVLKSIEDQIAQLTAPTSSPIASMKVLEPEARPLDSLAAGKARRRRLDSCSTICSGGDDHHSASPTSSSGDVESRANTLNSSSRAKSAAPDGRAVRARASEKGAVGPSSAPTGDAYRRRSSRSSRSKRDSKVTTRKDRASI